jgi:hypothetical protein
MLRDRALLKSVFSDRRVLARGADPLLIGDLDRLEYPHHDLPGFPYWAQDLPAATGRCRGRRSRSASSQRPPKFAGAASPHEPPHERNEELEGRRTRHRTLRVLAQQLRHPAHPSLRGRVSKSEYFAVRSESRRVRQRALDRASAAECPFNPHGELLNDRTRDPDSTQRFLRKTPRPFIAAVPVDTE